MKPRKDIISATLAQLAASSAFAPQISEQYAPKPKPVTAPKSPRPKR